MPIGSESLRNSGDLGIVNHGMMFASEAVGVGSLLTRRGKPRFIKGALSIRLR